MARARTQANTPQRDVLRVAAYLRVSTEEQADSGLGIGNQRTMCEAMATVKGWPAPIIYMDEGISGTKDAKDRPALRRLIADMHAGQIDAVIIRDLSRLARKARLILDLVDDLKQHGVALASCKESLDTTTSTGQFVLTMFAALAQLERDQTAERTKGALDERGRIDGEKGGRLPYGYVRTEKGVKVDAAAAEVVRRIFSMRRRGESLRDIAARVNTMGAKPPRGGATWRHTSIAEILSNRSIYAGGLRGASPVRWDAILGKRERAA